MKITLRLTDEIKNMDVDMLSLQGNKAINVIKRSGYRTIEDIVDNWNELQRFKGVGKETLNKIHNAVINLMIEYLPDEQLILWVKDLIEHNTVEDLREFYDGFNKIEEKVA